MTPPPFELPPPHAPQSADGQEAKAAAGAPPAGELAELTPAMAREIELWPIDKLEPYRRNARTHSTEQVQQIAASILEFGFLNPVLVAHGTIRAGHGRTLAAEALGMTEIPVVVLDHLTEDQARAFTIADNRLAELAGWDEEMLATELAELAAGGTDLAVIGFSAEELAALADSLEGPSLEPTKEAAEDIQKMSTTTANGVLALRFGVPPLSVLDMRKGYWQQRKAAWLALGIRSQDGRPTNLLKVSSALKGNSAGEGRYLEAVESTVAPAEPGKGSGRYAGGNAFGFGSKTGGTSAFDPVLCELAYRWWCPEGGSILDPFAGGSVRGIVAAKLGFSYCGLELRQEQVDANCAQAAAVLGDGWDLKVQWICADSSDLAMQLVDSEPFDFLFTCPPYYDLERYGDDPRDLSNAATYEEFLQRYESILASAVELLAPDRYACIVVSDIRDKQGLYRGFERDTQLAMAAAGAPTYNLAVLLEPIGPTAIRAGRIFNGGRKLSRVHQAVQVFAKGKPWAKLSPLLGPTSWAELDPDGALEEQMELEETGEAGEHADCVSVIVSAKSCRQRFHGCDPKYIAEVCHASCCRTSASPHGTLVSALPSEQPGLAELGAEFEDGLILPRPGEKHCRFETSEHLCELHGSELKPSGCIISPFTLSKGKSPKLVVANRYRMLGCFKDDRDGEPIEAYRAFRAGLDLVMGEPEADRLCEHLDAGGGDLAVWIPRDKYESMKFKAAVSKAGQAKAKAAKAPAPEAGSA